MLINEFNDVEVYRLSYTINIVHAIYDANIKVQLYLVVDPRWAALASCLISDRFQALSPRPQLHRRLSSILYLAELCVPVSSVAGRQSLRSASQGTLVVPIESGQNGTVDGVFLCQDHTSGIYCRQEFALSLRSLISSRENLNII